MQDVIKKLSAEQVLEVLKRLSGKGGKIQEAVLAEARDVLSEIDVDETADEVFFVLDRIVQIGRAVLAMVTPRLMKPRLKSWRRAFSPLISPDEAVP